MNFEEKKQYIAQQMKRLSIDYATSSEEVILNRLNTFADGFFSELEYDIRVDFQRERGIEIKEAKAGLAKAFGELAAYTFHYKPLQVDRSQNTYSRNMSYQNAAADRYEANNNNVKNNSTSELDSVINDFRGLYRDLEARYHLLLLSDPNRTMLARMHNNISRLISIRNQRMEQQKQSGTIRSGNYNTIDRTYPSSQQDNKPENVAVKYIFGEYSEFLYNKLKLYQQVLEDIMKSDQNFSNSGETYSDSFGKQAYTSASDMEMSSNTDHERNTYNRYLNSILGVGDAPSSTQEAE